MLLKALVGEVSASGVTDFRGRSCLEAEIEICAVGPWCSVDLVIKHRYLDLLSELLTKTSKSL